MTITCSQCEYEYLCDYVKCKWPEGGDKQIHNLTKHCDECNSEHPIGQVGKPPLWYPHCIKMLQERLTDLEGDLREIIDGYDLAVAQKGITEFGSAYIAGVKWCKEIASRHLEVKK